MRIRKDAGMIIFLGWLVYMFSYLGKVNYSANITQIIDFYGVTKAQAGTVPTFFFFAYGTGQIFNGLLCKRYNIKWMVFISLLVSASINLIIAVSSDFSIMKWLWMINGFALSILWPSLVRLLAESLPKKMLGISSVVMGTTVAIGTLVIYGLSSIYIAFDSFKLSFYTAGIAVIIVAFIWIILYNKAVSAAKKEREQAYEVQEVVSDISKQKYQKNSEMKVIYLSIYILCFYAMGVNLIKDGLATWVPSILKDEFSMNDSLSVLLTLSLYIVAVFGNVGAVKIHKIISDYIHQCIVTFAAIAVFVGIIIGSLTLKFAVLVLIGLVIVNLFASSLNSLITSIFPLFTREKVNSGMIAGVLNGFCYAGSALSSYGLGAIADHFGWIAVFWMLIGFCIVAFIVWLGYVCVKKCY